MGIILVSQEEVSGHGITITYSKIYITNNKIHMQAYTLAVSLGC